MKTGCIFYIADLIWPLSAKLLQLWAYFDKQDIWLEPLQHSDAEDPEWVRGVAEDELNFDPEKLEFLRLHNKEMLANSI